MEKLTLNDGHVRALKHLSKSWCYLDELRKDAELSDLWELMAAEYATHSTRDKRIFLTITNTGRAALAEYEAPPITPAPDDAATLKARIAELEANLANALEVSRIKGEELAAAIAENEGLHKRMAYRSKILQKARPIIMAMTEYVFNGSERRLVDLANDIDVALSNREDEQDGYGDE